MNELTIAPWQWVLWAAAAFNFAIGGGGLLQRAATRDGRVVSLLVACFGIVYALAAYDPARFAPALMAGVIGKLGVIAMLVPAVARGDLPKAVGWVLAGDGFFAGFFLIVLLRMGMS